MNILAPLNNTSFEDYVKAGASEFYAGMNSAAWHKEYGEYSDINRMSGFREIANPFDLVSLCKLVDRVKGSGSDFYATYNAPMYTQPQLDDIAAMIRVLHTHNCDGIIVSVPELIPLVLDAGMKCVASTMCGVYNSESAKFYRDCGCKRIILPRDLSLSEIESIVKDVPDVEFEAFLMRNGCVFSDSNCLGVHMRRCGSLCGSLRECDKSFVSSKSDFKWRHDVELNEMLYSRFYNVYACGQCAIYSLMQMGIAACKIVGRADQKDEVVNDIMLTKENISIARCCDSEEEYLDGMVLPRNSREICKCGMSCYYPEVRF